jgi:aryl-alcohol dehydrogenase-like predicted oxidoreductase
MPTALSVATVHPIAAVQLEGSLWTRDPEVNGVLAACRELGTSFVVCGQLVLTWLNA